LRKLNHAAAQMRTEQNRGTIAQTVANTKTGNAKKGDFSATQGYRNGFGALADKYLGKRLK
jgi:hypothetical protein